MTIDIYCDCASLSGIREAKQNPLVKGFTTNPTLMRQAGITDYEAFCKDALQIVEGLPISFEVFADEWDDMERQARKIASWGANVNVKIPVTNTRGESAYNLIGRLSDDGISCNVTAVFTRIQIDCVTMKLSNKSIISIFAGRIADTGEHPSSIVRGAKQFVKLMNPDIKILWASPRQVYDIYAAQKAGAHIITVTPDLLAKYEKFKGKDLTEFSLSTVKMFYDDALKANYQL